MTLAEELGVFLLFFAGILFGYGLRGLLMRPKYEARILDLMEKFETLSERVRKEKGKWLRIDYFIGEDGPVNVYECNVCAFEGTDDSDYCPECGSGMYGIEETLEGTRRRVMADFEAGVEVVVP